MRIQSEKIVRHYIGEAEIVIGMQMSEKDRLDLF